MHKVILLLTLLTVVTTFPLAASAQSDAIPSWIKIMLGGGQTELLTMVHLSQASNGLFQMTL